MGEFDLHPIMEHYANNNTTLKPLLESIAGLAVPPLVDAHTYNPRPDSRRRDSPI